MKKNSVQSLAISALLCALSFIGFEYLRIDIPLPAGTTAVHFGNAFLVLAALLVGGLKGGLAGAIGMTIADLMVPQYVISAPKTFILKLCIGLITGFVAHHIAKITHSNDRKYILKWTIIASSCGMLFNVIFDPLVSFIYNNYIIKTGYTVAKIFAAWSTGTTFINAITSIIIATVLYLALRPRLKITHH
ncbi:MAG: ECF transporter S component [Erysipelotrichaceae bacterium]|nr:ECF transporter S component [Erysipelotrichaceae bacterium]